MKPLIHFIIISLIAYNCQNNKADETDNSSKDIENTQFQIPPSNFVVLSYKNDWSEIFQDAKPTTLSESELAEIEKILKVIEYENNKNNELDYKIELKEKKRQYVPVLNNKGEKEIWVNFFCDDLGTDTWKKDIFMVDDGGNCYFNVKINWTNKTYSELYINGYA